MQENEGIKNCEWNWDEEGCYLEYDISYLHPDLGVLIQTYRRDSYDGKQVYQSDFSLFEKEAEAPKDFSDLPKEIKTQLWGIIFAIKRRFFAEYQPDIVEHFIDGRYSMEKRYELYRTQLAPSGYHLELNTVRRTVTYYKKEGGPARNGGPPLF